MFAALSMTDARELLLGVATIVGALVVVLRFFGNFIFKPLLRSLDGRTSEQLNEALDPMRQDLAHIKAEVTYNGGASLKDVVRRTELDLVELRARFDERFPHLREED